MRSAPRPPGAAMVVAPDGSVAGSVSGGCVESAVYEVAHEVVATGRPDLQRYGVSDDDAFSVGLTCGGTIDIFAEPVSRQTFPQLEAVGRRHRRAPPGRGRHGHRPPRPRVGRAAPRSSAGPARRAPSARCGARRRRRRRRPRAARRRAQRGAHLRSRRRTPGRGHGGLRGGPRTAAADDRLRRHRLRRRPGRARRRCSATGSRCATPGPSSRRACPVPGRRRGGRRLAAPLPRRAADERRDRRPHGDLRAHPRPQVRRAGARGGAAPARGRLRRRDGVAPHARRPASTGCARPA